MRKPPLAYWLALSIPVIFIVYMYVSKANADQDFLTSAQNEQATRACSLAGVLPKAVAVTGTSAGTGPIAKGMMRITCTTLSYMRQGVVGSTGGAATTSYVRLPADTPEYFYNPGSNFVSFIRDTSSGTCAIAECK